jgi:hypothetical protein
MGLCAGVVIGRRNLTDLEIVDGASLGRCEDDCSPDPWYLSSTIARVSAASRQMRYLRRLLWM